jgi:hypothetical protein
VLLGGTTFTLAPDGRLRAEAALGADEVRVAPELLPVLAAFRAPRAAEEVARELARRAPARPSEGAILRAIEALARAGLLVAHHPGARGARAGATFADVEVQRRMLADVRRAERFGAAIARAAPGKAVLEIGAGAGVLAVLAARAGARRVLAVEETPIAALAREVVRRNGVAGTVEVVEASSRELAPDADFEVLVAELLGGDPLDERLLESVADARERLCAPGAAVIPAALEVFAVAIEARDERLEAGARRVAELDEAARALAIDLAPVRAALGRAGPASFCVEVRDLAGARVLSEEARILRLDLARGEPAALRRAAAAAEEFADARVRISGRANAIAVFFRADLGFGVELSNAPFAPETHWGQLVFPLREERSLAAGRRVRFSARVASGALEVALA